MLLTHPQKTAWVAPQTLSGMAHWVGGEVMPGVCFVCPVLVIPVWERSPGQECKPLPAPLPRHFLPYQEAPSTAGPFLPKHYPLQWLLSLCSLLPVPKKKWKFREGNNLVKGTQLEDIWAGRLQSMCPKPSFKCLGLGWNWGVLDLSFSVSELPKWPNHICGFQDSVYTTVR